MIKYKVTLTKEERAESEEISSKGSHKSQKVLNALILMNCDEGEFQLNRSRNEEIAKVLNISMKKIDRVKKRFVEEGFEVALGGSRGSHLNRLSENTSLQDRKKTIFFKIGGILKICQG